MFQIIDIQTKRVVGTYNDRKRARRRADKLDLEYGAVRFVIVTVS